MHLLLLLLCIPFFLKAQNNTIVKIPDVRFKLYLVEDSLINTNGDSEIQVSEAEAFAGGIFVNSMNISDLKGIEAFINLVSLDCSDNQLTNLDISKNIELIGLDCADNQLTNLDISNNIELLEVGCNGNRLTNLDLSKNIDLIGLDCSENQMTSIDVSENIYLEWLFCSNNQLTSLDMSNNTELVGLDCPRNQLIKIDMSKNMYLEWLFCDDNQLTSLDISKNTELVGLDCSKNQLTSLDISKNTELLELDCNSNKLTDLDVSKNTELVSLGCSENQLTSLNLKNRNNSNMLFFNASKNTNLTCIQVDNQNAIYPAFDLSNHKGWGKDDIANYNENCVTSTSITDTIFNDRISIFPNPVSDKLTIKQSELDTLKSVKLYSSNKSKVLETKENTIDFGGLNDVRYFLEIKNTQNKTTVKKIIKKN